MRSFRNSVGWWLPWLLFLAFPLADLLTTPRPLWVQLLAAAKVRHARRNLDVTQIGALEANAAVRGCRF